MNKMKRTIFIFFFTISLFAQQIKVLDADTKEPVSDVAITDQFGVGLVTNLKGEFDLQKFKSKSILRFSHLSYKELILKFNRVKKLKSIFLVAKDLKTEAINIVAEKSFSNKSEFSKKIKLTSNLKNTYETVGDILKSQTTLLIKDYGGYTGMKTASSRGMSSENTIVLFNEARVCDIRSGVFDFSKLSSLSIDKIEFLKISDAENSFSSAGGVLKIYTDNNSKEKKLQFNFKKASANVSSISARYKSNYNAVSFGIEAERALGENNYTFDFLGNKYKRKNSGFNKTFLSANFSYSKHNFVFKFYSHFSHLNNGIPGYVVTNNIVSSRAKNLTDAYLGIVNIQFPLSSNCDFHSTISYQNQLGVFTDPDRNLFLTSNRRESRFNNFSFSNRLKTKVFDLDFLGGYEYTYSDISGMNYIEVLDNPLKNYRYTHRLFFSIAKNIKQPLSIIKNIKLLTSFSFENSLERTNINQRVTGNSYSLSSVITPSFAKDLNFKFHFFSSYRNPTLNERYFSSLFFYNELLPETYSGFDFGFDSKINLFGELHFSAAYYLIKGTNKIVWLPSRMGIQKPQNFGKVQTSGFEISFEKLLLKNHLTISVNYNYTKALNKNNSVPNSKSYNKLLLYSPLHKLNTNAKLHIGNFSFYVFGSFESERFYTADNSKRNRLKDFFIMDVSTSFKFKLFNYKSNISLNIYNLLNEKYFIVQSYPMPLINYSITYNLEIQ